LPRTIVHHLASALATVSQRSLQPVRSVKSVTEHLRSFANTNVNWLAFSKFFYTNVSQSLLAKRTGQSNDLFTILLARSRLLANVCGKRFVHSLCYRTFAVVRERKCLLNALINIVLNAETKPFRSHVAKIHCTIIILCNKPVFVPH